MLTVIKKKQLKIEKKKRSIIVYWKTEGEKTMMP